LKWRGDEEKSGKRKGFNQSVGTVIIIWLQKGKKKAGYVLNKERG